ncbi:MAG: Nuclease (SNase domain protein) [Candidatus Moranbacteria bacterium GW2011_GWF2_36_839]|nr:MAG: Nuclease (SNase domain protein) [Candidatus Moranbacteria bacterium GW2011_GWF1_36_78]KKQ17720.1 MAG: Nuclease (SNase domain protein) [Candidatus Moranbacteria bacterium GW2011_GWF2_36_839]
MDKNVIKAKTKDFWQKYEYKIILIIGFVLVAVISFEGGVLKSQKMAQNPLIIEKPADNNNQAVCGVSQSQNLPTETKKDPNEVSALPQNCAFVGSKNSNKYHLSICRYAKNISPKNLVCFSSKIEAESRGYLPDKNCIK